MIAALDLALLLLALPTGVVALYLGVLTLLSRRGEMPRGPPGRVRFDVVVPAHDEQAGIAETVASLRALEWPRDLFRLIVVADNCTDRTAQVALEAGAQVLVRTDPQLRGKGHALRFAFDRCLAEGFADAVVVVDADTLVDPGLLAGFAARLAQGAQAVQADYAVRNPEAGWRTRLMAIGFALFHRVRSLGRERLGLSSGLRGNGMCFAAPLLVQVPYDAFSVVEDVEFGLRLGERGHRVHYADEAHVWGQMVTTPQASLPQRQRWEGGRRALARTRGLAALKAGLRRGDRVLVDLAVDLLIPPLAQVAGVVAVGTLAAAGLVLFGGAPGWSLAVWGTSAVLLATYVARGWQLSGTGVAGLAALGRAPVYLAWKLVARASRLGAGGAWVRTTREAR